MDIRAVRVEWWDSHSLGATWIEGEEAQEIKIAYCETLGFLLKETEKELVIAQSKSNNHFHNLIAIPKGSIIKMGGEK